MASRYADDTTLTAGGEQLADTTARVMKTSENVVQKSESESERYLFDPHKKFIQSNNEKHLGSGDPY